MDRSDTGADPTRPMRVILVTPGFPPDQGGVEIHTGRLATELAALGLEVRVLTARRCLTRPRIEKHDGLRVHVFPAWRTTALSISPRLLLAGLRAFRDADLVHVHSYHAACGFAALTGFVAPVVFTPHYHGDGHSQLAVALHRVYRFIGRALFRSAHAVVCVSRAERDAILRDFPSTAGRTRVVPNGVDTVAIRAAEPFVGEPPTVLSLGRLEPYKGVASLVRAVPALPQDAQLVVVGQGSQREELEKLTVELGVADRVRFLGVIDTESVHRWLRTARVLVSLSEHEAFGMAPLEAACAGARVVLSDIAAHREIAAGYLRDTARLVSPEPGAVAAAVAEQLDVADRVEVDVPNWGWIASRTGEVYRTVCTRPDHRQPRRTHAMSCTLRAVRRDTDRTHTRRIALIDRPWVGHRSVMFATPLETSPIDQIRAVLAQYMSRHPGAPLSGRIDEQTCRWIPVPEAERQAHLDRVLIRSVDPEPGGIEEHISVHLPAAAPDLPFVAVVGDRSICLVMSHAVGDATTMSGLLVALARADQGRLAAIEPRTGTSTPLRALVRQLRPNHRQWIEHLRNPASPPARGAAPPAGPPRPAFAGSMLSNARLREVTRWRNANAPGVSVTSVLTAAVYRALTEQGLNIHGGGCYALIDIRAHLPRAGELPYGNLGKSIYLTADLNNPRSVDAALGDARNSGRALPAIVVAATKSLLWRPVHAQPHPGGAPLILTFNSLPVLPGMSDLPWHDSEDRRFYGFGLSTGPSGITVIALRLREHLQLTASFDESTAHAAAVRRGLEALTESPDVLAGLVDPV